MKKYDDSLKEVWNWKEEVYNDLKDLKTNELIDKIKKSADKILSDNSIRLSTVSSKKGTESNLKVIAK